MKEISFTGSVITNRPSSSFGFEDEPTWRCQSNPLIRALGIQEPVIPGEPLIKG